MGPGKMDLKTRNLSQVHKIGSRSPFVSYFATERSEIPNPTIPLFPPKTNLPRPYRPAMRENLTEIKVAAWGLS